MPIGRPMSSLQEKFWDRVSLPENSQDCWEWIGHKNEFGYGVMRIKNAERNKNIKAHLLALELSGLWPIDLDDAVAHHLCENRKCVNPDHLVVISRGAHTRLHQGGYCKRGHLRSAHTYVSPKGKTHCRECQKIRNRGGDYHPVRLQEG